MTESSTDLIERLCTLPGMIMEDVNEVALVHNGPLSAPARIELILEAALLEAAALRAGPRFAGLGVVVTLEPRGLPLYPIGPPIELSGISDPSTLLGDLAVESGAHHDGFHILTAGLKLVAVSQYFSPPVVAGLKIDRSRPFGGRYFAALFGSVLPGTIATGIATTALGTIIFSSGREVYRKPL